MTDNECCSQHANLTKVLDSINTKLDAIMERLGHGDVQIATLNLRVSQLEKLCYGALAAALTSGAGLIGTVIVLVIKGA